MKDLLDLVAQGQLSPDQAMDQMGKITNEDHDTQRLQAFARIDHQRSKRTGFPEVIFGEGKTAEQVCAILDDMAHHVIQSQQQQQSTSNHDNDKEETPLSAIVATRITPDHYQQMQAIGVTHGTMEYNETARIVTMIPHGMHESQLRATGGGQQAKVVVASAGTTDIFVCEEAAVLLEAAGCRVDRVYDAGVAGLHRILNATPQLRDPEVQCVIVCAGMDGALPSVVGGLVSTPVIAVPTSVGYGAAFGGVSCLLTMLNSCSPGVMVVNIDNGFGAAAGAYKIIHTSHRMAKPQQSQKQQQS